MKVWILGAGQLGAMLRHAGMPLDIDVCPVALDSTEIPAPGADDIISPEIEHWPDTPATRALAEHPNLVNRTVFARLADRLTQKQLIDSLGLATAPWREVDESITVGTLYQTLGKKVLLKQRRGGYDGRGQLWLKQADNTALPDDWRGAVIAEQAIAFDEEVSLVGMRDAQGHKVFYPLTLNLHVDGILTASISPLPRLATLQAQAEGMLGALLDALDYVGVMAMECFRLGDRLLINELAPRVHNSGHWTQAGASRSQFESHLRAICGLPLPTPTVKGLTVMINLLGVHRDDRWLTIPAAELYWYGKEVRPARKVGHINLCLADANAFAAIRKTLTPLLSDGYEQVLAWVADNIGAN
ncbi:MAG: 5-(carboxyamino)imidazole ribonucleotide synthase [Porticoccaceae bacterium]